MDLNSSQRVNYFTRQGNSSIAQLDHLIAIHGTPSGYLIHLHENSARKFLYLFGQDTVEWDGKPLEVCLYHLAHDALAAFRQAEDVAGVRKVHEIMGGQGIPHNHSFEHSIMESYSQLGSDHITCMNRVMDIRDEVLESMNPK